MENKLNTNEKNITRTVRLIDGTLMHIWNRKLHSYTGPALIPQGNKKLAEYYIFGIKYSKDSWNEAKKNQVGTPYYKSNMKLNEGTRF